MIEWRADVLGDGFTCVDIALEGTDGGSTHALGGGGHRDTTDARGTAAALADSPTGAARRATLVRALPRPLSLWQRFIGERRPFEDVDVLYVHGWNDYFFQRHTAQFFTDRGARFFALDLRGYGRSLDEGQVPGYIEDLASYDAEIHAALQIMGHGAAGTPAAHDRTRRTRRLVMYGHSTGGLVLSLWCHRNRGVADVLLLNSPWLALQVGDGMRRALAPVVNLSAKFAPHELALPQLDFGFYHQAQRLVSDPDEQAAINRQWRPEVSPPVRLGWLNAILSGHRQIAAGIDVGAPACVLLSTRTVFAVSWRDEMTSSDTVLDVDGVAQAALGLGPSVTIERIEGAIHDVFLSAEPARTEAFARVERWLLGQLVADRASSVER